MEALYIPKGVVIIMSLYNSSIRMGVSQITTHSAQGAQQEARLWRLRTELLHRATSTGKEEGLRGFGSAASDMQYVSAPSKAWQFLRGQSPH